jgi:hypothetical protein
MVRFDRQSMVIEGRGRGGAMKKRGILAAGSAKP